MKVGSVVDEKIRENIGEIFAGEMSVDHWATSDSITCHE